MGSKVARLIKRRLLPKPETLQRRGDAHHHRLVGIVERAQCTRFVAANAADQQHAVVAVERQNIAVGDKIVFGEQLFRNASTQRRAAAERAPDGGRMMKLSTSSPAGVPEMPMAKSMRTYALCTGIRHFHLSPGPSQSTHEACQPEALSINCFDQTLRIPDARFPSSSLAFSSAVPTPKRHRVPASFGTQTIFIE